MLSPKEKLSIKNVWVSNQQPLPYKASYYDYGFTEITVNGGLKR